MAEEERRRLCVLIVGGTSPVGRALLAALSDRADIAETAVVSRTHGSVLGAHRVIRGHFADLAASDSFRRDLGRFDAVVHLGDGLQALLRRGHGADAESARQLIEATRRLAVTVRDRGVGVFVYLSSIRAVAGENDERILTEDVEPHPGGLYGRTKLRLERTLAEIFEGSATRCICLRTPVLYGTNSGGNLLRLLRLADTPYALPFGNISNRRSLLSLRNLASAIAVVLFGARGAGDRTQTEIFHIHDGRALSTTEIVEVFRAALGRRRRLFPFPSFAVRLLQPTPILGPAVRSLFGSGELSDRRFRQTFAWMPCEDSATALTDMARAYTR
ncbi:MAG: NAD-dependent epimerase/dehydratase family protein [Hyphomicrobiaceae bacterium]